MEAVKRGSKRDFGTVKVESGNCDIAMIASYPTA